MIEGQFIVLEGVDGAGTTTHTGLLVSALKQRGLPVHATREPSDGPVGMMLRQIIAGRLVVPSLHGVQRAPSWATMALLFAADRMDHLDAEVVPNLMDGVAVVSDRYDYSSIAYQSLGADDGTETIGWIRGLNAKARRPDLTIVLDVAAEEAARRRAARRAPAHDIYEEPALQERLVAFYARIEAHFPGDRIVHVDANQALDAVAAEIEHHVRVLRNEAAR